MLSPTQEARRKRLTNYSFKSKTQDTIITTGIIVMIFGVIALFCCMIVYGLIALNGYPEEYKQIWNVNYYLFVIAVSLCMANPVGVIIGLIVVNNSTEE